MNELKKEIFFLHVYVCTERYVFTNTFEYRQINDFIGGNRRFKRETRVLISTRNILMKYSYVEKNEPVRRTSPRCPHVNTAETIWLWIMNICGILASRELHETCTGACHTLERWCLTVFLRVTKRKFELESDIENKTKDERRGWKKPTARGIPYFTYIDPVGCLRGAAVLLNIDRRTVQSPRVVGS